MGAKVKKADPTGYRGFNRSEIARLLIFSAPDQRLKAPPSPPSENATASGDQARQSSTNDRSRHRHRACGVYPYRSGEMCLINTVADYVEDLRD